MEMELDIPPGTVAAIIIPENVKRYTLNDEEHASQNEASFIVEIKSGEYKISYNNN